MRIRDGEGRTREIDVFFDKQSTNGRPQKILTEEALKVIESMASRMTPEGDIADVLGVSINTLKNENNKELFDNAIKKGFANAKQSLRREMFDLALKGNPTMQIFLAKNFLGMTDKSVVGVETEEENKKIVKEFLNWAKDTEDEKD